MSQLLLLDEGSEEAEVAKKALFTKHPEMMGNQLFLSFLRYRFMIIVWLCDGYIGFSYADWPEEHDFRFFKLEITNIFLINWYGGAKPITVDEYLHAKS